MIRPLKAAWRAGRPLLICLLLAGALAAHPAQATVLTNCTEAALRAAVAAGGSISLSCGPGPSSITLTSPLDITAPEVTIDGGGSVTLRGGGGRIIRHHTYGLIGSSTLTLKNLTISGGRASGTNEAANGAAIISFFEAANPAFRPTLNLVNVTFSDNRSTVTAVSGGGLNAYDFGGGAIYARGGYVNISSSSFSGNQASNGAGGAIHILQSRLTISDSSFVGNTALGATPDASLGGAISIDGLLDGGSASIVRSSFSGNTSYNSGGAIHVNMYENTSELSIDQSSFVGNAVVGGERAQGGAIGGGSSTLGSNPSGSGNARITITRSTFSGNSARRSGAPLDGSGGALGFPQRARINISSSTFADNRAEGSSYNANGGALYVSNNTDPFTITSSTFANNYAGWVGGAITGASGVLSGTLFSGNSAGNGGNSWLIRQTCSDTLASGGANLQFPGLTANQFNLFNDRVCADQIAVADPQLGPLADNGGPTKTMALGSGSPALDAGGTACPATDQRGTARPQGSACDLGAFELVRTLTVTPGLIAAGGPAITLIVRGGGFSAQSQITWGGTPLPTTRVSATELRATLSAAAIGAPRGVLVGVSGSALPAVEIQVVSAIHDLLLPLARR